MKKHIKNYKKKINQISSLPLLFFIITGIILLQGCVINSKKATSIPDTDFILRVGLVEGVPQLVGKNLKGELTGLDVDLLTRFAKKNNYLLERSLYSKEELFFALRRGEIDIAIPCTTDTVISNNFLLPCASHLKTGQRLLVNAAVAMFINNKDQLNNDKITILTAVGSPATHFAKKILPKANLISLRDIKSCIKKTLKDNGNIIMLDASDAYTLQSKKFILSSEKKTRNIDKISEKLKIVLPPLTKEHISWAVRKGDQKWSHALNLFIQNQRKSGELQELIELYHANIINE